MNHNIAAGGIETNIVSFLRRYRGGMLGAYRLDIDAGCIIGPRASLLVVCEVLVSELVNGVIAWRNTQELRACALAIQSIDEAIRNVEAGKA